MFSAIADIAWRTMRRMLQARTIDCAGRTRATRVDHQQIVIAAQRCEQQLVIVGCAGRRIAWPSFLGNNSALERRIFIRMRIKAVGDCDGAGYAAGRIERSRYRSAKCAFYTFGIIHVPAPLGTVVPREQQNTCCRRRNFTHRAAAADFRTQHSRCANVSIFVCFGLERPL